MEPVKSVPIVGDLGDGAAARSGRTYYAILTKGREPYFAVTGSASPLDVIAQDLVMLCRPGAVGPKPWVALVGESAEVLLTAVTGRVPGCGGDTASVEGAELARKVIDELALEGHGEVPFYFAKGVVEEFGPRIKPYLGLTLLGERGQVLVDDERYEISIELGTVTKDGGRRRADEGRRTGKG